MTMNPYESPQTAGQAPMRKVRHTMPSLLGCLGVAGVIVVVIALLLPLQRSAREPARRATCNNNLKQIGLALQNYHDAQGEFPPAFTVDANGKPLHSWRTLILPYMEQETLYKTIDLSKPWDDPANKVAFETSLKVYSCPSARCPAGQTVYLAVVAPGGCFQPTHPRKLEEITDDIGLTLMVVEVDTNHAVHWMSPNDASERIILSLAESKKLPHRRGFMGAYADAGTSFLRAGTSPETLRALISIAGNDDEVARTGR